MANLIRRNQNREISHERGQEYGWDPFRMLDAFFRWDPFRSALGEGAWQSGSTMFAPAFDVKETKDAYVVRADLPGVRESEVELSVTGKMLTLSGRREQEHREDNNQYFAMERSYGSFMRTLSLPEGANLDDIKAELKDGVLTLHIPKRPEVQPRKIAIGKGDSKVRS